MKIKIFVVLSMIMTFSIIARAQLQQYTISMVGDIMMGTTFPQCNDCNYLPQNEGEKLFENVTDIFEQSDLVFGNLEGTIFNGSGKPKKCKDSLNCYLFRSPEHYAENLKNAHFDALHIANNHINDFGWEGRQRTCQILDSIGIAYAGVRDTSEYAIIEKNGKRWAFAAFGYNEGMNEMYKLDKVKAIIEKLNKECDFVIVSFHGGAEGKDKNHVFFGEEMYLGENRGDVVAFAHTCVDAGADIIFGHGPHVARAFEAYKGKLIAYSLGNFCTPFRVSISGISGYAPILNVTLADDGSLVEAKIIPFVQRKGAGPQLDVQGKVIQEIKRLTQEDFPNTPLRFDDNGVVSMIR